MNRSEMKKVAEGLKASRPERYHERETIDSTFVVDQCEQWKRCVREIANALELKGKPRSIFFAAAGYGGEA